jgi:hypothetical protein
VTRADSGKPEKSCKMRVGEYRRDAIARIELVSFPRNRPEREREKKKMACFDTDRTRMEISHGYTQTHTYTEYTQREIKKKETIDYSTK